MKRVERWRRIAHEASQQSRRVSVPTIAEPITLKPALERTQSPSRILLSETEQSVTLSNTLGAPHLASEMWEGITTTLAIGPEGGWTPEEMSLFTQHQWTHVTLGPRILRAETAAIAAVAIASTFLS
jgi:16S rRNA (uracil1498-N3)-methyltransferase